MKKIISVIMALGGTFAAFSEDVSFREGTIVLPTYAPGGYDKTPLFYTGRVYQGAQGRVYPYPMQDVLHDEKIDETYKYQGIVVEKNAALATDEGQGHPLQ